MLDDFYSIKRERDPCQNCLIQNLQPEDRKVAIELASQISIDPDMRAIYGVKMFEMVLKDKISKGIGSAVVNCIANRRCDKF